MSRFSRYKNYSFADNTAAFSACAFNSSCADVNLSEDVLVASSFIMSIIRLISIIIKTTEYGSERVSAF